MRFSLRFPLYRYLPVNGVGAGNVTLTSVPPFCGCEKCSIPPSRYARSRIMFRP